jgi:excisionase family DNA binding protein
MSTDTSAKSDQSATSKLTYTVEEAAQLLGFKRDLAYREIGAGRLKTYVVGARRFVSHRALLAYVADRERDATPKPSATARGKGRKRQPVRSDGAAA